MKKIYLFCVVYMFSVISLNAQNIEAVIAPPVGCVREACGQSSFTAYLRQLPLLPKGSKVLLYNGKEKGNQAAAFAVVDVAIYPQTGKKVFLLAQSYMPAQQIHILVNPANRGLSPWYELSDNDEGKLYTPEWVFEKKDLKRFK